MHCYFCDTDRNLLISLNLIFSFPSFFFCKIVWIFCLFFFFFSPLLWHFSQLIHRPRSSPASVLFTFVVGSRCVLRSCRQIVLARTSCVHRWGTAGAQRSLPSQKPLGLCCLRSRPELSVCEGISACSPCFARVTVPAPCLLSKERARPPSAGGQMSEGIAM